MSSEFKEVNLDRTRLKEVVEEFIKINSFQDYNYSIESNARHRVKYKQDDCDVVVEFHLIKNGTTTINPKIGKYHDKGEKLALYLKDNLVADPRKSLSISIKNIDKIVFDLLLNFFQELEKEDADVKAVSIVVSSEDTIKKIIKATSQYNDSLTLTYFKTTNTLSIQGKPLYVYQQISFFLSEHAGLNGFLEIVYKGEENPNILDVVSIDAIEAELTASLPNAYCKLGEGILIMLRTSCTLKSISIPLQDYSCYVFPSLRALEGVIRRVFSEKQYYVESDNENSFRGIFSKDFVSGDYTLTNDFKRLIGDRRTCNALESCYTYYVQQRHELFHANDFTDSSRFIPTEEQAKRIIEKVLSIIDTVYKR